MRGDRRRTRLLAALALAALAFGAAGYAGLRIATRESSRPASVREAVARFRALPAAARSGVPGAPTPGVYVYATRGYEISDALGTRRHAYPPSTTITVATTDAGCVRMRWDVLATRRDADVACRRRDGAWRLVSESEEHAFAGHDDRRTYRCTHDSIARPPSLRAGTAWRSSCAIHGTTTADRGVVLGRRTLTVAGRRVATVLLRTRTRVTGDTTGTGTTLTWIRPGTGLIVRRTIANDNVTDTIVGDVSYRERVTLALR